jgi:hypothetical protein
VSAAVPAAQTVVEFPRPGGAAAGAEATLPLPLLLLGEPFIAEPVLAEAAPAMAAPDRPGLLAGAVRGLLVTPWFAAATGFVVAVGLWISAPHAELKFPSAVGIVPCQTAGCGTEAGQGAGRLAITGGQQIHPARNRGGQAAQTDAGHRTAATGLTFGYLVLFSAQGKFEVQITVTGKHAPSSWHLAFAMPDDQISYVVGAAWQPDGRDAGTASPQDDPPGQWGGGDPAGQDGQRGISFTVFGQGAPPAMPTGCTFNKATCRFS